MMIERGSKKPTRSQMLEIHGRADDSFTASPPNGFDMPCFPGWVVDPLSGCALEIRNVDPHTDDWVGKNPPPRRRAAIFWLMRSSSHIWLQVGNDAVYMNQWDYVLFDDRKMHSVIARQTWVGCAYQVRGVLLKPRGRPTA